MANSIFQDLNSRRFIPGHSFSFDVARGGTIPRPSTINFRCFNGTESVNQLPQLVETCMMKRTRKQTFSVWSDQISPSKEEMINAGFCSCKIADRVICLYCNLICQQWTPLTNNPLEVHKKFSPKCPYITSMLQQQRADDNLSISQTKETTVDNTYPAEVSQEPIVTAPTDWFPHRQHAAQLCIAKLYEEVRSPEFKPKDGGTFSNILLLSKAVEDRLDLPVSIDLINKGFRRSIIESCYENQLRQNASITTLILPSIDHHVELVSNRTYRDLFLRQYFLNLLNISQPKLIQTHHLIPQLEQIQYRRRRQSTSIPISTISSSNCSMIKSNEMLNIFSWFHSIQSYSSIELIYNFNRKISSTTIPIRITIKQSNDIFIMTYLQYDINRDFYFIDLSDYLRQYQDRYIRLEIILFDQLCSTSYGYLIFSSNRVIFNEPQTLSTCRLKSLQIKFDELGLANLIIRPQKYVFTYCDGSCSNNHSPTQSSFRTYLQTILNKKHSNIPPLNCHPSEYANDYFLLRQIDGHMEIYPIQNAIVKRCACL